MVFCLVLFCFWGGVFFVGFFLGGGVRTYIVILYYKEGMNAKSCRRMEDFHHHVEHKRGHKAIETAS